MGISRCLCLETVWTGKEVGMQLQIDSRCGWKFMNNMEEQGCLKKYMVEFDVDVHQ